MKIRDTSWSRLHYLLLLLGVFVALFFLIGFINVHSAEASPGQLWARWRLKVYFDKGQIESLWTVQVLEDEQVMDTVEMSIPCAAVGDVTIINEQAYMNGGHIECETGDFANIVSGMYGHLHLPPLCQCKDTWGRMVGQVDRPTRPSFTPNPVIYLPDSDIRFSIIRFMGLPTATMRLDAGPMMTEDQFTMVPGENKMGSRIHDCDGLLCDFVHAANGSVLSRGALPQNLPIISTHSVQVLIGKDDVNVFQGILTEVDHDPGCSGVGDPG